MDRNEFHIILSSDSSMKYHFRNTATKLTTSLPHQIDLKGDWVVALKEIQYPCNLIHINDLMNQIHVSVAPYKEILTHFPPRALYSTVDDFRKAMNHSVSIRGHFEFSVNKETGMAKIRCVCSNAPEDHPCYAKDHRLHMSPKLVKMMGFDEMFVEDYIFRWPKNLSNGLNSEFILGRRPISLERGSTDNFYVYSDCKNMR